MIKHEHELEIISYPYVGDLDTVYFAHCSCGKYSSGKWANEKSATKAWTDHYNAKKTQEEPD